MIRDAQEYINELKTYRRYVSKKQEALNKYNDIEMKLEHLSDSYVSPGYVSMVEVTKYVKGKKIKKKVPMPKLDPDPMRRETIRKGLIEKQCELANAIKYYESKIAQIKEISDMLPPDLKNLCWDVYVKKKGKKIAHETGYSVAAIYHQIYEKLKSQFSEKIRNFRKIS